MKSMADRIREKLTQNPKISAGEIAEKLGVTPQHVYQIRHELKKKQMAIKAMEADRLARARATINDNDKPLSKHILDVLMANPDGMTDHQLAAAVKKNGYITRSNSFMTVLRAKLYNMVEVGHILKNGTSYSHPAPVAAVMPVMAQAMPILVPVPAAAPALNIGTLSELSKFCKQNGGIEVVQGYLDLLRDLK